ncbi:TPA: restriction endonuclease subunit S [Enterobacter roggenkampii]
MSTEQVEVLGKYQPYPEYKDSGVEWLGEVPQHWQTGRLGSFGYFISGCGFPHEYQGSQDGLYPFYKVSDTNNDGNEKYLSKAENYVSKEVASKLGARICSAGGIMFPKVGAALLGNKRRILTLPSITDNNTMVYFSYEGNSSYWYYWLSQLDFGQLSNPGPVPSINESQLKDFVAICPTQYEQRTIAAFLDYETARIDKLIAQHQRLIELLKEKRQAVISRAVTKGLNPDAPMKDSGVEWLGEVPEHWGVKRFNHVINYLEGPGILAKDFHDDGTPLLRIQNVKGDFVSSDYKTFLDPELADTKWNHFKVKSGDLIISCSASTGLVAEVNGDTEGAIPYTGLIRLRCGTKLIDKNFIKLLVQSDMFFKQIERLQTGSTIQHYGPAHLQQMYVYLPSLPEQKSIVSTITQNLAKCEFLTKKAEDAITLMQERRTALISAAVTGKIDLRGWTAPTEEVAA